MGGGGWGGGGDPFIHIMFTYYPYLHASRQTVALQPDLNTVNGV